MFCLILLNPPVGQASFLPGRVGNGVISGKHEKKVLSADSRLGGREGGREGVCMCVGGGGAGGG